MKRLARFDVLTLLLWTLLIVLLAGHATAAPKEQRYQVSKAQVRPTDMGRTGGTAAYATVRAWVAGPEDEATWCVGVIWTRVDGTKSSVIQDCPSWADHLKEVDAFTTCEDKVVVTVPGETARWDCKEPFQQQRLWELSDWYGIGTNVVRVQFVRGEILARAEALVIVPGGGEIPEIGRR